MNPCFLIFDRKVSPVLYLPLQVSEVLSLGKIGTDSCPHKQTHVAGVEMLALFLRENWFQVYKKTGKEKRKHMDDHFLGHAYFNREEIYSFLLIFDVKLETRKSNYSVNHASSIITINIKNSRFNHCIEWGEWTHFLLLQHIVK